jgi:hypothetical protein
MVALQDVRKNIYWSKIQSRESGSGTVIKPSDPDPNLDLNPDPKIKLLSDLKFDGITIKIIKV